MRRVRLGVFDSGVGGKSVADAVAKAIPVAEIILRDDKEHLPYGTKTPDELLALTEPIFHELEREGCEVIVVACNTVTTTIINKLREVIKTPLVGMEPMVKPAVEMSKTGTIAVCATPSTLASARYQWLKDNYAKGVKVLEPDCSNWAEMIETDQIDRKQIENTVEDVISAGTDVIVLGCTHYHWIEDIMRTHANGRAQVIQPIRPVISQLKTALNFN